MGDINTANEQFNLYYTQALGYLYPEKGGMEVLGITKEVGTYFSSVIRELRDPSYGLRVTKFREVSRSRINRELASGALVVCADDQPGLDYGHIFTLVGDLGDRYKVADPAWGWPTRRDKRYVVRMARGQGFAVRGV